MKKHSLLITLSVFAIISPFAQASGEAVFNALGCSGCHGAGGKSVVPTYPSLAKSVRADLDVVKQLKDFQSGVRQDPTMNAMAPMAAGQEQIIADYLAAQ